MTARESWNMARIANSRPLPKPRALHKNVIGEKHAANTGMERCYGTTREATSVVFAPGEVSCCKGCGYHVCSCAPKYIEKTNPDHYARQTIKRELLGYDPGFEHKPTPEQQYHPETLRLYELVKHTWARPIRCTSLPGFVIHADLRFAKGKVGIGKTGPEKSVFCHPDELIKAIDSCRLAVEQERGEATRKAMYEAERRLREQEQAATWKRERVQREMAMDAARMAEARLRAQEEYQRRYRDTMNGQAPLTRSEFQEALAKF